MNLSIIIVSYNVKNYLRQCINSIYSSKNIKKFEVIVIDNYSFDDSTLMIRERFPDIKLIQNYKNLGFSKAINQGIKLATGKFLCFLNPDTLVQNDTFSKLTNYIESNTNIGCIGPKIINANGTLQKSCKRSFPTPLVALPKILGLDRLMPHNKYFGKYNLTYLNEDEAHFVDAISGSFMLLPNKVVRKIGFLDEKFFMFGEDLDYCFRIKESGYNILYYPETEIIHYKGESVKHAPIDMIKVFYSAMNIFFEKYQDRYPSWKFMKWLVKVGISFRKMVSFTKSYLSQIFSKALDFLSILLSSFLSINLWYPSFYEKLDNHKTFVEHLPLLMNIVICWFLSSYWIGFYKKNLLSYGRSSVVSILTLFLSSTSTYFISIYAFSRGVLLLTIIFHSLISAFWRVIIHLLYRYGKVNIYYDSPLFTRRAAILGIDRESQRIAKLLNNTVESDFNLMGYIGKSHNTSDVVCLGHEEDIKGIINVNNINELIIPENKLSVKELIDLIRLIGNRNISIKIVPSGSQLLVGKGMVENLSGITLIDVNLPLLENLHLKLKRIFDILLSLLLIILTLPLQIFLKLFLKTEIRNVWNEDGSHIRLMEFISKKIWIRELPYLFTVLSGQLSFVGCEIVDINFKNPNLLFKPGLTGLNQIRSRGSDIKSDSNTDYYYLQNQSLIFDMEILIKTLIRI